MTETLTLRGPYTWGAVLEVHCAGCGKHMDDTGDAVVVAEPLPAKPCWYHGACYDVLPDATLPLRDR
jgi:hypothetical protein